MLPRVTWLSTTREIRADSSFVLPKMQKLIFERVKKHSESVELILTLFRFSKLIDLRILNGGIRDEGEGNAVKYYFSMIRLFISWKFFSILFFILGREELLLVLFTFNSIRLFNTFNPNCN